MLFVKMNDLKNRYADRNKTIKIEDVYYSRNAEQSTASVLFNISIKDKKHSISKTFQTIYNATKLWNDFTFETNKNGDNVIVSIDRQNFESLEILYIALTNSSVLIEYQRRINGRICAAEVFLEDVIIEGEDNYKIII